MERCVATNGAHVQSPSERRTVDEEEANAHAPQGQRLRRHGRAMRTGPAAQGTGSPAPARNRQRGMWPSGSSLKRSVRRAHGEHPTNRGVAFPCGTGRVEVRRLFILKQGAAAVREPACPGERDQRQGRTLHPNRARKGACAPAAQAQTKQPASCPAGSMNMPSTAITLRSATNSQSTGLRRYGTPSCSSTARRQAGRPARRPWPRAGAQSAWCGRVLRC
ncbi:hypothetical protein SAMN04488503_1921 [Humidesulfovibrio mexicanus]|uniref:Uncharacterized protein n=1 Tax=Humidesulfovibrio mexicanus TaxID=147047 RepID=A0A239A8U4_9BACT|nr:hypothetical protein SAMN04488503_1921 [Humidesulfovibrio mexicanus]